MQAEPATEFQYPDAVYQAETAISGMWLFLASEVLFFGVLFLCWLYSHHQHPAAFAAATARTEFGIGTANSVLLLTSSLAIAAAVAWSRLQNARAATRACVVTAALGALFLGLKAYEWWCDIKAHDVPGAHFHAAGTDTGGEQLFWIFYWAATGLHFLHMLIGIALVAWVARRLHRQGVAPNIIRLEVTGLYWSFVDMVWMVLYPLIYLAAR